MMWIAVTLYALGTVAFVSGFVFRADKVVNAGILIALAGAVAHGIAIGMRWVRLGHGPYLGFFEVVSSYAFIVLVIFLVLAWRFPALRPIGLLMLPMAFLLLAAAMLTSKAESGITPTLASWWLTIHVLFAKLCYGSFVAAFSLGLVYLLRERGMTNRLGDVLDKLPRQPVLDDLTFKFVGVGFIFLGIMIAAGAIWANEAWGRYWAWDPIETWSLIAWLVYAAVLHARLTMGWKGKRFALATVLALPIVVFALIGVPIVYNSIHGAYIRGTGMQ